MKNSIHPLLRTVLILGGFLSLMAGIQLFLLARQTDVYFAWTIQSPLTAAIIGSFFFGTMTFGFLAWRETAWENVRGAVMGLFLLLCLKLAATLLHIDRFHLTSDNGLTVFVTWVWLLTYVVLPIAVLAGLILQARIAGSVGAAPSGLPAWLRVVILLHGLSGLVAGAWLFLFPDSIIPLWGWALTPLTSRALSAWFLPFAVVDAFLFLRDHEWRRMRIVSVQYCVSVLLILIAIARFGNEINWQSAGARGFLAYLAAMLVIGLSWFLKSRE